MDVASRLGRRQLCWGDEVNVGLPDNQLVRGRICINVRRFYR